ncbi:MAG: LLM class flavin-dependent oxidoreductase [Acidimicrobiales bacterium]
MTPPTPTCGLLLLGAADCRQIAGRAAHAEAVGLDHVWIPDERFYRDPYLVSAQIAALTVRVTVGPCVTDPYMRNPAVTAAAVATLDEISDGRAVLGIGAGGSGFSELGVERTPGPVEAVEAAVATVRRLLAGERTGTGAGFGFRARRARIPVHVAAEGPQMLRLAGRIGDGVVIQGRTDPALIAAATTEVLAGAAEAGRDRDDLTVTTRIDVALATSRDAAVAALRPSCVRRLHNAHRRRQLARHGFSIPASLTDAIESAGYTHDPGTLAALGALVPDDVLDAVSLAATPADLGERLDRLVDAGIDHVLVNPVAGDGTEAGEELVNQLGTWRTGRAGSGEGTA